MKIVFCITRMDEYGGAQVHLRDLCLWMKGQGHDVTVLSGRLGIIADQLQAQNIRCILIPDMERTIHCIKDIKAFIQIREKLKQVCPDIVACHSSKAGLLGRLAAKSCGLSTVFTAHGWAFTNGISLHVRLIYIVLERLASFFSDKIITVSDFDKNLALKYHVASPEKIITIHNGVASDQEKFPDRELNKKPIKLIMVARVGAQKDHALLLKALTQCMDLSWTLDLVGGGDYKSLLNFAQDNGLISRVRFLGERDDVTTLLRQSDIFLLISNWEGFPISILEAMQAGLPVIASDVGGVQEAVFSGQTGVVVPPGDESALVSAIRDLICNGEKRLRWGKKGQEIFLKDFTFSSMAQKTFSVYFDLLTKRDNS